MQESENAFILLNSRFANEIGNADETFWQHLMRKIRHTKVPFLIYITTIFM